MSRSNPVKLEWYEVAMGAHVGEMRHTQSIAKGLKPGPGYDPRRMFTFHCEGACAELAVAKFLGVYWAGTVNTFQDPVRADLGRAQIKRREQSDHAIYVPVEAMRVADVPYILVTGFAPHFNVRGWVMASEARKNGEFKSYKPGCPEAYWVEQKDLKPMPDFPMSFLR